MTEMYAKMRGALARRVRGRTGTTHRPGLIRRSLPTRVERLFSRYPHRQLFGVQVAVVQFDGAVYFVPRYAARRPVARRILRRRYAAPELHRFVERVMTRRPGSMVHAGTFFGDMLPSFSRKTSGRVYAFEPVLENYLLARATTIESELHNVMLLHAGLGVGPGLAMVETRGPGGLHRGGSSKVIADPAPQRFKPQSITLLSIDQFAIDDLSLIQLDVEGYELAVLQGAAQTIKKTQPVIVIEDDRRNCADFLKTLGYSEAGRLGRDHVYLSEGDEDQFNDLALVTTARNK